MSPVIMKDLIIYIPQKLVTNTSLFLLFITILGVNQINLFRSKALLVYKPGVLVIVSLTSLTPLPTSKKTNYHFHEHIYVFFVCLFFFNRMLKQYLLDVIIFYPIESLLKQK